MAPPWIYFEMMKSIYEGDWLDIRIISENNPDKRIFLRYFKILFTTVSKALCETSGFNRYYYQLLMQLGLIKGAIIFM